MPPFRIHNPRVRSNRVLIRTVKGQTILVPVAEPILLASKPKKKISMSQIKQVIQLLQQSKDKNLTSLLGGLPVQDDEDVDVDEIESEGEIEVVDEIEEGEEVLIIEL